MAKILNKGDGVIIEEPGYLGAIQAFMMFEPEFYPVTLEHEGLKLDELEAALKKGVKFAYTVPNFQNPTGLTYTQERRDAICELFNKYDTVLIEDDPYGELRFKGSKLPYIGAGKLAHSVIHGSFSKTVTPGMRLGFMLTQDDELMQHLITAKQSSDLHTNIFSQYMIYDYLAHNEYQQHVDKIVALYKEQSDAMLAAIKEYFPANVKYTEPEGGMFIWVTLPEGMSALKLFHKAMEKKVAFVPGDPFYVGKSDVNTFRLNYTNSTDEVIREGIKRLGEVIKESMASRER